MSTITPFPGLSRSKETSQEDFEREVAARFGLLPNFFRSTPDAPLVIRELWLFAKSAYLDNPSRRCSRNGSLSISPASAKFATASRDTAASYWDSGDQPAIQMRQ
jgi:hypothetical protein